MRPAPSGCWCWAVDRWRNASFHCWCVISASSRVASTSSTSSTTVHASPTSSAWGSLRTRSGHAREPRFVPAAARRQRRSAARPRVEHRQSQRFCEWCRDHNVRYLNTSVEVWDPYLDLQTTHPVDRTLYVRHMQLRRMMARGAANDGATAVVEHGANPGLVSHFVKQALGEISTRHPRPTAAPAPRGGARNRAGRRRLQRACSPDRHQGDPHQRARHADHRRSQGVRRVRQHVVRRRFLRRRRRAGRDGLGHARAALARRTPTPTSAKGRAIRSAWPSRA